MDLIGTIYAQKYRLTTLLGEGAFGKVFLGKSIDSNFEVAVKIVFL